MVMLTVGSAGCSRALFGHGRRREVLGPASAGGAHAIRAVRAITEAASKSRGWLVFPWIHTEFSHGSYPRYRLWRYAVDRTFTANFRMTRRGCNAEALGSCGFHCGGNCIQSTRPTHLGQAAVVTGRKTNGADLPDTAAVCGNPLYLKATTGRVLISVNLP